MAQGQERLYNTQKWNMDITVKRPAGDSGLEYKFPANFILEMVIEESLLDWPVKGYLVYFNPTEVIEKGNLYNYRMDAKDEITIEASLAEGKPSGKAPKSLWTIKHEFVIYDTEDIDTTSFLTKAKKIYFWDKRYQKMMDKNVEWSTATTEENKKFDGNMSQKSDDDRSMLTGDAIKALLKDNDFISDIDEAEWNKGSSKIFYTSPADARLDDDLNAILKFHYSDEDPYNDPCIFYTNREKENKFQLLSLRKFHEQLENKQYEKMFLEDFAKSKKNNSKKGDVNRRSPKGDTVGQYSVIYSYNFVDTAGINNTNALITKPVYWYDPGKGQFGVDLKYHEIETNKDDFNKAFLQPSKKWLHKAIFTLNDDKKQQYNIDPRFRFADATSNYYGSKKDRYPLGRNETLYSGIFLNECLAMRMPGIPFRTRGMFIGVERVPGTSDINNTLDHRLLGVWFLVKVQHIWKHDMYVNDIICTKMHSWESLKISDDAK